MKQPDKAIYITLLVILFAIAIKYHVVIGGIIGMIIGGALAAPAGSLIGFAIFAWLQYHYCN